MQNATIRELLKLVCICQNYGKNEKCDVFVTHM